MSARFEPGKPTEILYAAKNYATGLTDVKISLYTMDGVAVFEDILMTEMLTSGVYKHRFNMPTTSASYMVIANSDTEDKQDSAVIYSGGFPGDPKLVSRGGGLVQRHLKTTWTEKEKVDLIVTTTEMAKKVDALVREKDRLKDMVGIQKQLLDVYTASVVKIASLESTSKEELTAIREGIASGATEKDVTEVINNIKKLAKEIEDIKKRDSASSKHSKDELKSLEVMKKQLADLQEQSMILIKSLPDDALDQALEGKEDE